MKPHQLVDYFRASPLDARGPATWRQWASMALVAVIGAVIVGVLALIFVLIGFKEGLFR